MATLPPLRFAPSLRAFRADALAAFRAAERPRSYKPLVLAALLLGSYAVVYLAGLRGAWLALAVAVSQPIYLITALGIAHDASHRSLSKHGWVNRLGVFVFDLLGVNGYVWHYDHVVAHHAAPNVARYDANLYVWGPLRLDPHTPLRPYHRYQHLYAIFLYALASLFKVYVEDFTVFARTRSDAYLPKRHRRIELVRLVAFKAWAVSVALIGPILVHGEPLAMIVGYLAGHVFSGLLMGAIFQPTHTNELVTWANPDERGRIGVSWEEHVLATAADFCTDSALVTWICGGLNIHAVHHLFPRIPQEELRAASRAVAESAKAYGLVYRTFPTWGAALVSHFRALKRLGVGEHERALAPSRIEPRSATVT
ncbi:MAG: fatty acid desaturase [Sandaracinaceae bacterium]